MREAITGVFEDQLALRVTRAVDVAVEVTRVLAELQKGLEMVEHAPFVERLSEKR